MTLDLFAKRPAPAPPLPAPKKRSPAIFGPAAGDAAMSLPAAAATSPSEERGGISVSAVNALAREVVEGALPPMWVTGEVANFTRARSGHCYFTLRDAESQIRCVMWRPEARRLPATPPEGFEVRAFGSLTIYERRGEFQLVVSELEGRGEGLWRLAFDRLRAKLDSEGLLAPGRKRPLPPHPLCVGVVTSTAGAALRDVITVLRRRAPWARVVIRGCRVQGEGAAEEIAAAIRCLAGAGCADLLIVGRGGGSVEDLWAFNQEVVARAIADSPIPTISAVGHETDVTIADLVADLRAATPSAAAEAAVPDAVALARELAHLGGRLVRAKRAIISGNRRRCDNLRTDLGEALRGQIRDRTNRLGAAAAQLNALSPLAALSRGYAVPLGEAGRVLRGVASLLKAGDFALRMADGEVPCTVRQPEPATEAGR